MKNPDEFETVASGNSLQADLMRMQLESEGIEAFLHGEFLGTIAPHLASPGGVAGVRVQVRKEDAGRAQGILSRMNQSE